MFFAIDKSKNKAAIFTTEVYIDNLGWIPTETVADLRDALKLQVRLIRQHPNLKVTTFTKELSAEKQAIHSSVNLEVQ
jgi:hypothetical protein